MERVKQIHKVYHKFYNWLYKTYGSDLISNQFLQVGEKTLNYKVYNDFELSKRLIGYEVIGKVEKYCKKYCPEIKIIKCDDADFCGSVILLIPHQDMGITILYIPQCTQIQNQFFLYQNHFNQLTKALEEMKTVYKDE